jgi:hypothetical protein
MVHGCQMDVHWGLSRGQRGIGGAPGRPGVPDFTSLTPDAFVLPRSPAPRIDPYNDGASVENIVVEPSRVVFKVAPHPRVGSSNLSERAKQNQSLRPKIRRRCLPGKCIWEVTGKRRRRRELRAMERLCLEQSQLCRLPESRAALEELAQNYRAAIVASCSRCGRVH